MAKDNSLALCIVIIVIVGLFLHYEMGYNFELFNVGAKVKKYGNHNRHRWWQSMGRKGCVTCEKRMGSKR